MSPATRHCYGDPIGAVPRGRRPAPPRTARGSHHVMPPLRVGAIYCSSDRHKRGLHYCCNVFVSLLHSLFLHSLLSNSLFTCHVPVLFPERPSIPAFNLCSQHPATSISRHHASSHLSQGRVWHRCRLWRREALACSRRPCMRPAAPGTPIQPVPLVCARVLGQYQVVRRRVFLLLGRL